MSHSPSHHPGQSTLPPPADPQDPMPWHPAFLSFDPLDSDDIDLLVASGLTFVPRQPSANLDHPLAPEPQLANAA